MVMLATLESLLGAPVVLEELKRRAGRRRTLRARGSRRTAIVKLYTGGRAARVAARLDAIADGPAEPRVPRVLSVAADGGMIVLSHVPGAPFRQSVSAGDVAACARVGAALGRWHRHWSGSRPVGLSVHTLDHELEALARRSRAAPTATRSAVEEAVARLPRPAWDRLTVVHRDLYEEQVMVARQIGLIDLDDAAIGPPELDIGNLFAHLDLLGHRSGHGMQGVKLALLEGYRTSGLDPDPERMAQCSALTLLRLACIHRMPDLIDGRLG